MSEATRPPETWSAERKHHPYSPSTLQNREACACYESRNTAHIRAIAGTLAHNMVEARQDNRELSDADALNAAECMDFIDERKRLMEVARTKAVENRLQELQDAETFEEDGIDDLGDTRFPNLEQTKAENPEVQEFKEIYLKIDDCGFEDSDCTTGGYLDTLLIDHTESYGEMADWKFGAWPVEHASNNLQCIAYVLGAFKQFPKLNTIRFFFRQPMIDYHTDATFTRAQIPALYLRVQTVVARARRARALTDTGDFSMATPKIPACNFCSNIGRCPKILDIACSVGAKFFPIEIPSDITPTMVLTKEQTNLGLRLAQIVKVWADSFRTQTTNRILEGRAEMPEGFTLQSSSRRELIDKDKFKSIALQYITEEEYVGTLDVLFGAVEKVISTNAPRLQKKKTVEAFQNALHEAGATKDGLPFTFLRAKATEKI